MWQDYLMAAGQIGFFIALLPSLFSSSKPHWGTCLMTAIVLTTFVVCFDSLNLRLCSIALTGTTVEWYILLFQSLRRRMRNGNAKATN